jgi:hypothetical protein
VRFWLTLQNYSNTEKQVRIALFDPETGRQLNEFETGTFIKVPPGPPLLTKVDVIFHREQDGYAQISAKLEFLGGGTPQEDSLTADNVRHSMVLVQTQVPVLIVDSANERQRDLDGADTRHISAALEAAPGAGYAITKGGEEKLNDPNLLKYSSIFLLNVGTLTDLQAKNLKNYVFQGGSVAFFLGKEVNPAFYNEALYDDRSPREKIPWADQHFFPVKLANQYYPPRDKPPMQPNLDDDHYKVLLRDENFPSKEKYPIFGPVIENAKMLQTFTFLPIRRFYPIDDLPSWKPRPGVVDELATLPNLNKVSVYGKKAREIRGKLMALAEKHSDYARALRDYDRRLNKAVERDRHGNDKECYELAQVLDELLHDHPTSTSDKRADMLKFWEMRDNENLKNEIADLYRTVRYGFPLVIASRFGRGRVVTVMTTAGKEWNGWLSLPSYVPMVLEMQSYLTSLGGEANLTLGEPVPLRMVPPEDYQPQINITYHLAYIEKIKDFRIDPTARKGRRRPYQGEENKVITEGDKRAQKITTDNRARDPRTKQPLKQGQPLRDKNGKPVLDSGGKPVMENKPGFKYLVPPLPPLQPGLYVYELTRKAKGNQSKPVVESQAFVYNVDTRSEGDLTRVAGDQIEEQLKGSSKENVSLYGPFGWAEGQEKRKSDFSQTAWFYLIFLIILVAEQALAVHLSFHLQDAETALPLQAVRSQAMA